MPLFHVGARIDFFLARHQIEQRLPACRLPDLLKTPCNRLHQPLVRLTSLYDPEGFSGLEIDVDSPPGCIGLGPAPIDGFERRFRGPSRHRHRDIPDPSRKTAGDEAKTGPGHGLSQRRGPHAPTSPGAEAQQPSLLEPAIRIEDALQRPEPVVRDHQDMGVFGHRLQNLPYHLIHFAVAVVNHPAEPSCPLRLVGRMRLIHEAPEIVLQLIRDDKDRHHEIPRAVLHQIANRLLALLGLIVTPGDEVGDELVRRRAVRCVNLLVMALLIRPDVLLHLLSERGRVGGKMPFPKAADGDHRPVHRRRRVCERDRDQDHASAGLGQDLPQGLRPDVRRIHQRPGVIGPVTVSGEIK